jgi:hypothetical protein
MNLTASIAKPINLRLFDGLVELASLLSTTIMLLMWSLMADAMTTEPETFAHQQVKV